MFIIKFRSEEELPEGYFKHVKLFCETLCATTLNNLKDPLSKKKRPPAPPPHAVLDGIQKRPSQISRICSKFY